MLVIITISYISYILLCVNKTFLGYRTICNPKIVSILPLMLRIPAWDTKKESFWDLGWWTKKLDILRVVFLGWWPRLPREWLLLQLGSHGSIRRASVADPLDFLFSLGSSSAAAGAFTIISHLWQHHFAASAFAGNETHPFEKPTDATVNVWQPWRILWLDDFIVAASCFINLTVVAIPSPSIPIHPRC